MAGVWCVSIYDFKVHLKNVKILVAAKEVNIPFGKDWDGVNHIFCGGADYFYDM